MLTKEQLEFRKTGIGGSEITALWGMNKYTQPIDVFYSKRTDLAQKHGYTPRDVSGFAVDRGNFFEDPTAALYTHLTGVKVRKSNIMHRHPKYPWLIANIDRKIEGERAVLEIKTVSPYSMGDWGQTARTRWQSFTSASRTLTCWYSTTSAPNWPHCLAGRTA